VVGPISLDDVDTLSPAPIVASEAVRSTRCKPKAARSTCCKACSKGSAFLVLLRKLNPPSTTFVKHSDWSPGRTLMPVEQLTYSLLAERLGVTPEAARALARRHHLPRLRGNDGKALIAVDLEEIQHKPMPPARSPRGHRPVSDVVATLTAKVEALEAELVAEQQRAADRRADYESTSAHAPIAWSPSRAA
jgi:hypothetical protein